jgi:hypothetical protein
MGVDRVPVDVEADAVVRDHGLEWRGVGWRGKQRRGDGGQRDALCDHDRLPLPSS